MGGKFGLDRGFSQQEEEGRFVDFLVWTGGVQAWLEVVSASASAPLSPHRSGRAAMIIAEMRTILVNSRGGLCTGAIHRGWAMQTQTQ